MTLEEIMTATGASKPTVYRWIRDRGFPKPVNQDDEGRQLRPALWDGKAFYSWWASNGDNVGRWPAGRQDDDA